MKNLKALLIPLLISFVTTPALAMDSSTRDQVIQRLERVLEQMDKKERAWVASNLRLADLLAERARERFMQETEANCKNCKGSQADRERAIGMYEEVLKRPQGFDESVVLFQLAHLHDQAGDATKPEQMFKRILAAKAGRYPEEIVDRARTSLADLYFHKGQNKEALKLYQEALSKKTQAHNGLVRYRIAWCQFHTGQLVTATKTLETLAGDRASLTRQGTEGLAYDEGFHSDVVRDLAIFYSRRPIKQADVARYRRLSPVNDRGSNLLHFAEEADRIGQKAAAEWIYQTYLKEPNLAPEKQLEVLVRLAQVKYDRGDSRASTAEFALAAQTMKKLRCETPEQCEKVQKRMKYYVTELHRSQKTNVTLDVARSYFIYSRVFPSDLEMALRGAQVSMDLKQYVMATNLYREASVEAQRQISKEETKQLLEWRRVAVLGEVEAAELTKDIKAREAAYIHALKLIPEDKEAFAIRYQLARVPYEQKQWAKAASAFRELALDKTGDAGLRKQSADLALDSLVMEKRDADIETLATEFASALPAHADEFRRLSRKAVMAQVAQTANNDSASNSELNRTLKKLLTTDVSGATENERILHLKNTVVVARKVGDKNILTRALGALLATKSLSAKDREDALAQLVGEYEARLDFAKAYETALQMRFTGLSQAEKERRLGTLADLAGRNPSRHYNAALNAGLKGQASLALRARLVGMSANPMGEFKKQQKFLKADRQLFAETLLMVYAKTRDLKAVRAFTQDRSIRNLAPIRFIEKQPFYVEHQTLARQISIHRLRTKSDRQLQTSLQERLGLLKKADASVKKAVALGDFTAQVITLTTAATENERMAMDITALPLPAGLKPAEQQQYQQLIAQQAAPYSRKAQVVRQKLSEFWGNEAALNALIRDFEGARPEMKSLLRDELRLLAGAAPSGAKSRLDRTLAQNGPEREELLSARENVRREPNDRRQLERLKALETKIGHPLMSSYLEVRLNSIQKGDI